MIRNRFIELGEKAPNLDDGETGMHDTEASEEETPETPIRYKWKSFSKYNTIYKVHTTMFFFLIFRTVSS